MRVELSIVPLIWKHARHAVTPVGAIGAVAGLLLAALPACAQQAPLQTCSDVHAYCLSLCAKAPVAPPPTWVCEVDRCFGLQECLSTGQYRIGTQYGHRPSNRTSYGPYEKK
jgi:hypothetical protein